MAEHVLATRIQLRYDTYSNWMNSRTILKAGEVAVARVDYASTVTPTDNTTIYPYAIGLKVGDGESYFYELPWVQGVASDVYSWAKSSTKPAYNAGEIEGLQEFVEEYSGGGSGGGEGGTVAARIYQIVQGTGANANKYYLQYKTADSDEWITDISHYIDLNQFVKIANWIGEDVDEYFTLGARIYSSVNTEFYKLNLEDEIDNTKVVVGVNQVRGKIEPIKRALNLNNLTGPLSVSLGGTGLTTVPTNHILVGNENDTFLTRSIEPILDDSNNLATNLAIKQYVDQKTAGLTGAMHFIGEATVEITSNGTSTVNPQISGYNFNNVQYGDVILSGNKEFVWAGSWKLLGDEGSYAVKGSIVNVDISPDAQIDQSKINGLLEALSNKVNIVEGKGLSTFDFTKEFHDKLIDIEDGAQVNAIEHIFVNDIERPIVTVNGQPKSITLSIDVFDEEHATKLDGIETGAQVNVIEHIFLNNTEIIPTTVNNLSRSVNLSILQYTDAEKTKLAAIEAEAQVNKVESITINGSSYTPNSDKIIEMTLDPATLNLSVLEGARYPSGQNTYTDITITDKKLDLSQIAATGDVSNLLQTTDTYIVLDCGSSTEVI